MRTRENTAEAEDNGEGALEPLLRFPEFRGAVGWTETCLGKEGEFLSSLSGKAGCDFDTGEAKFVTYMNVFSNTFVDPKALRLVDVKSDERQNAIAKGDVFFTISSETPEDVGMSSVVLDELENCYLNSFCALFRFFPSKRPNPIFAGYLLRQQMYRNYFTKKAQGSTRFNLTKDALRELPFIVPKPAEQQKIAECLRAVDEVISAQARKVSALKSHKKGLMQQLLPREGETMPRLRFPEFQSAGAWVAKRLHELVQVASGQVDPRLPPHRDMLQVGSENIESNSGKLLNVRSAREKGVMSGNYTFDENDILYSKIRPALNKVAEPGFKGICSADIYPVRPATSDLVRTYLLHLLLSQSFLKHAIRNSERGKIPKINRDALLNYEAIIPSPEEQHRIAGFLQSIDAIITAEEGKLAAVERHKYGLMRKIFPSFKT